MTHNFCLLSVISEILRWPEQKQFFTPRSRVKNRAICYCTNTIAYLAPSNIFSPDPVQEMICLKPERVLVLQLIQVTKSRIEVFRGQTCLDNSSLGLRSRVILDCVMFMFKLTIMKFDVQC